MKADLRRNDEDGPEREELRAWLRQWDVPAPPSEIEDDLRQAFRLRRPERPALWLRLAAAAAVLVSLWWIGSRGRVTVPAPPPPEAPADLGSPPPSAPVLEGGRSPAPAVASTTASARPVPRRRAPTARPPEVIVEAGQARLLADLGRRLGEVRQAAPGVAVAATEEAPVAASPSIPTMRTTSVPVYEGEWEAVAGEWPYVHVPAPGR